MELIADVVKFILEALYTYAASDAGRAELVAILDGVEAAGIDVPFYEPSSGGVEGEQGGQGDIGNDGSDFRTEVQSNSTRKIFPKVSA